MAATVFGVWALGFMIAMHALESKSRHVVAAFAVGVRLVEQLRLPREPWPLGVVEGVWTLVALRRYARSGLTRRSA